jgi:hypothetical protein
MKLPLFILVALLMASCTLLKYPSVPKNIKQNIPICYDGSIIKTEIDTPINGFYRIIHYFTLYGANESRMIKDSSDYKFWLLTDGLFKWDEVGTNKPAWGIYEIIGDTIKTYSLCLNEYKKWDAFERWFLINHNATLTLLHLTPINYKSIEQIKVFQGFFEQSVKEFSTASFNKSDNLPEKAESPIMDFKWIKCKGN